MDIYDKPESWAIVRDPKLKSTWSLKIVSPGEIEQAITSLTEALHGNALKASSAEKRAAIPRIRRAIKAAQKDDAWKKKELARLAQASKTIGEMTEDGLLAEQIVEYAITEFKGVPPDVPTASRVNIEELTAGDEDPMFVRMNVATVGKVSLNHRRYNKPFVQNLVEQINTKPLDGGRGHLSEAEYETSFPIPEGFWVGAILLDNGEAWAKAYIPKSPFREFIRHLKATGGKLATSIFGPGRSKPLADDVFDMIDIDLQKLDFASYERAALKPNGTFQITAEMEDEAAPESETTADPEPEPVPEPTPEITTETRQEENPVTPEERAKFIKELTADDLPNLPEGVITAVLAKNQKAAETKEQIAELTFERDTLKKTNDDLVAELATFKKEKFGNELWVEICTAVEWDTTGEKADEAKQKLGDARNILKDLIEPKLNGEMDIKKAKRLIAEAIEGPFKSVLESYRDSLSGPSLAGGSKEKKKDFRDRIAEDPTVANRWGGVQSQ